MDVEVPRISRFLLGGFHWYIPRMMRRNFNAFRIAKHCVPSIPPDRPAICFLNHPGWWDPLVAHFLNARFFDGRDIYAPIDEAALEQYAVFKRLGFFGVNLESTSGAKRFLSVMNALLQQRSSAVWLTPSGAFGDARSRTVFQPGLGHVLTKNANVALVPLAIEYPFWDERTPELLVEFGPVILADEFPNASKGEWTELLETRLAASQASLAAKAIARDASAFENLLDGRAGAGGLYDGLRRLATAMRGERFDPRHRRADSRYANHV